MTYHNHKIALTPPKNKTGVAHTTLLPAEDGDGRGQGKSMLGGAGAGFIRATASVYFPCGEKEATPLGIPDK